MHPPIQDAEATYTYLSNENILERPTIESRGGDRYCGLCILKDAIQTMQIETTPI